MGSWDLLVNEVTEHRTSKHWDTRFGRPNYLGRTRESDVELTNDFSWQIQSEWRRSGMRFAQLCLSKKIPPQSM